ncbi:MAG TPA: noncanonical pyrimidine nucleotidase, YjjG family [Flavobacteriales bacterium]|nr:YjjG family noncanonical pyrimidine nucleotidase [Flavobacteriales bacterium]MDB9701531.1 YjjG family noncanonical pyrimidine nucleotidase [Salibacteraceae bacterium]HAW19751.1 noncanonical pyrimidine nucleotidase, YjjG family [Flavobacteriales bacterium]
MDKVQHIYFDLDHTLWDFEANSRETLGELFDQFEIGQLCKAKKSEFIDRYVHLNNKYWALYRENRISKARLRTVRFESTLKDFGIANKPLSRAIGKKYVDLCPTKTKLNDGAIELLNLLKDKYPLHILSNGFHEVQLVKLASSGLDVYFDHVITSEMANAKKPNPRIFQFANKKCQATADESLMIGDNLEIDVRGAVDFGWKAIHYNPSKIGHELVSVDSLMDISTLLVERGDK